MTQFIRVPDGLINREQVVIVRLVKKTVREWVDGEEFTGGADWELRVWTVLDVGDDADPCTYHWSWWKEFAAAMGVDSKVIAEQLATMQADDELGAQTRERRSARLVEREAEHQRQLEESQRQFASPEGIAAP